MKWLKKIFHRLITPSRTVQIILCSKKRHVILGQPWEIQWPNKLPMPEPGDIVFLPSPHFLISAGHFIQVIVIQRHFDVKDSLVVLYCYEPLPQEDFGQISQLVRKGDF